MPAGAPSKLNPDEREEVLEAFEQYIIEEEDPTVVGFVANDETAIKYNVTRDNINDWDEFSTLKKRAITKQEAYLLKNGTQNKINPTLAIFRLKQPQHGYKDKFEQDISHSGQVQFTNDVPRPPKH